MSFKTRRVALQQSIGYGRFESRRLLAGNVQAFVDDGILLLVGDGLANEISLTTSPAGGATVTGVGTTINGGTAAVNIDPGFGNLTADLAGGDDRLRVDGFAVGDHFSVFGGDGADRVTIRTLHAKNVHIETGAGDDVMDLQLTTRKSAHIDLGEGVDIVSLAGVRTGRNLKVFAGGGNDTVHIGGSTIGRKLRVESGAGNDEVLLAAQTRVRKRTQIALEAGDDFLGFAPTGTAVRSAEFRGRTGIDAGDGNDRIAIDASAGLGSGAEVDGGAGTGDALQNAGGRRINAVNFETARVAGVDAAVEAILQRLRAAGVDLEQDGEPELTLAATATALVFTENGTAVAADPGLTVTAAGGPNVTGAEVRIGGFVAGGESLQFDSSGGIAGSFNATTGVLTLSGSAAADQYQTALRSVRYVNTSDAPATTTRQLSFLVNFDGQSTTATRDFRVTAVNDVPAVQIEPATINRALTALPVTLAAALQLGDPDHANLASATVTISSGFVSGRDRLAVTAPTGMVATFDPATGALTMTGSLPVATWQTALRSLAFDQATSNQAAGSFTVRFTVNDGQGSGSDDVTLLLTA